jgi:predicted P-loop ATPase
MVIQNPPTAKSGGSSVPEGGDLEGLLRRLEGVKRSGDQWVAKCPAHEDRAPSLTLKRGDKGGVLLYCHAGCQPEAVCAKLGLTLADLSPPKAPKPLPLRREWEIRDAGGEVVAVHVRTDDGEGNKDLKWRRGTRWGLGGLASADLPLYGSELAASFDPARPVYLCEGEKACDALRGTGAQALGTVTGASGTPGAAVLEVLRGRRARLWPDNDDTGKKHMQRIAGALGSIAAEVVVLPIPEGVPPKGDAFEWVGLRRQQGKSAEDVRQEIDGEALLTTPPTPPTMPPPPPPVVSDDTAADPFEAVSDRLQKNKKGTPYATTDNALTILAADPRWEGILAYDEFRSEVVARTAPPWDEESKPAHAFNAGSAWTDDDDVRLSAWLSRHWEIKLAPKSVAEVVQVAAKRRPFHPVRDYLLSLRWDGTPRLGAWLTLYAGAEDTSYTATVGRMALIAAVARVIKPGVKADYMLILEGQQGKKKSTLARILAGDDWFSDSKVDFDSKEGAIALHGVWIQELGELSAFNKKDIETVKRFLTVSTDRFRPPYGRRTACFPRQSTMIGTTNETNGYLQDHTGGRRFWPVETGTVDLEALRRDRDQLWAEAVEAHRRGERWYPDTDEEHRLCANEVEQRQAIDPWEETLEDCLRKRDEASVDYLLGTVLGIPTDKQLHSHSQRVGKIMTGRLRWKGGQKVKSEDLNADGRRVNGYKRRHDSLPTRE